MGLLPCKRQAQTVHMRACRHGQSHLVLHTDPDQVADARSIQHLEAGHERERGSMQSGE